MSHARTSPHTSGRVLGQPSARSSPAGPTSLSATRFRVRGHWPTQRPRVSLVGAMGAGKMTQPERTMTQRLDPRPGAVHRSECKPPRYATRSALTRMPEDCLDLRLSRLEAVTVDAVTDARQS